MKRNSNSSPQKATLTTPIPNLILENASVAAEANLHYITNTSDGITRIKKGKGFCYKLANAIVKDKTIIKRIQALAIPPAWQKVWICKDAKGHIQATGIDAKNRKQYRYHPLWNVLTNEKKFHRMIEFGEALPAIRLQIEKDLSEKILSENKVIATVIALMERTYIRVGNEAYKKLNDSYGLTTLQDKHVTIDSNCIQFSFKGKKSIHHTISLQHKKLAKIVKACRDIPGKELFQYYTPDGNTASIDSGMVNAYIKNITQSSFTAKDFRTWAGCLHFITAFKEYNITEQDRKNVTVNQLFDAVSKQLGNTRTVCKKYYVHPALVKLFEDNTLEKYINQLNAIEVDDCKTSLTKDEFVLMEILKKVI